MVFVEKFYNIGQEGLQRHSDNIPGKALLIFLIFGIFKVKAATFTNDQFGREKTMGVFQWFLFDLVPKHFCGGISHIEGWLMDRR
jgi:hypothetical protein